VPRERDLSSLNKGRKKGVGWKGTAEVENEKYEVRGEDAISRNGPRWALLLAGSNSRRGVNCPQSREEKWREEEEEKERERERQRERDRERQRERERERGERGRGRERES